MDPERVRAGPGAGFTGECAPVACSAATRILLRRKIRHPSQMAAMSHIEIRDVSLFYDTPSGRVHAVDAVSFDIATSEFICIVGPSGCGKSTLLNIIAGFIAPTGGE